jgi:hypothetical protein
LRKIDSTIKLTMPELVGQDSSAGGVRHLQLENCAGDDVNGYCVSMVCQCSLFYSDLGGRVGPRSCTPCPPQGLLEGNKNRKHRKLQSWQLGERWNIPQLQYQYHREKVNRQIRKIEDVDKYLNFALDVVRIVAPFAGPALGISLAAPVLSKLGVRISPGRPSVLGFKSHFRRSKYPSSVRTPIALHSHPAMSELYDLFKTVEAVSTIRADVNQVSRPSPEKTLRVIEVEGGRFLIPSYRATAYILHNNSAKAHSVAQIREVLKCQTDKSNINKQQLTLP